MLGLDEERWSVREMKVPMVLVGDDVDETKYCKVRKEVEKWLDPYLSHKKAIEMADDLWMPKLVAKYGAVAQESKDVPFYREMIKIVENSVAEENLGDVMEKLFKVVEAFKPELVPTQSTTERAALTRLDPDKQRLLEEKMNHVRLVDMALSCLDEIQLQIITDMYLVAKRLKTQDVADKLERSPRLITQQKKAAIIKIAKSLNII